MTPPAPPRAPERWPGRALLLQRQQVLLRHSAALRGEIDAELRAGWQGVKGPLDLGLRLREWLHDARQGWAGLRAQHPWLVASLLPVGLPLLRWLARRWWRRVQRPRAAAQASSATQASSDPAGGLLSALRWLRRAWRLLRLLDQVATPPPPRR